MDSSPVDKNLQNIEIKSNKRLLIRVPIREEPDMPLLSRIHLRLTTNQAKALRVLYDGLVYDGEKVQLTVERDLTRVPDAIRYFLDKIYEKMQDKSI